LRIVFGDHRVRPDLVCERFLCHQRAVCFDKHEQYIHRSATKFDKNTVDEHFSTVREHSQVFDANHGVAYPID